MESHAVLTINKIGTVSKGRFKMPGAIRAKGKLVNIRPLSSVEKQGLLPIIAKLLNKADFSTDIRPIALEYSQSTTVGAPFRVGAKK